MKETTLEQILTNAYKEEMISFLNAHPEHFEEAIELAISDKQPYSWRSAWLLWSCMEENDSRIHGYINKIIDTIKTKKDGHQRELLKILLQMELDEKYEGYLFDVCVTVWEQVSKRPSVRFTAFQFIIRLAKKYPDLSQEIAFLMQRQYLDPLTPGIKRSVLNLAKKFNY